MAEVFWLFFKLEVRELATASLLCSWERQVPLLKQIADFCQVLKYISLITLKYGLGKIVNQKEQNVSYLDYLNLF